MLKSTTAAGGKTTLLNHILTKQHGKRIAVIENEFGDVGIDDALLQQNMKDRVDGAGRRGRRRILGARRGQPTSTPPTQARSSSR